jgi:hypothetical protein
MVPDGWTLDYRAAMAPVMREVRVWRPLLKAEHLKGKYRQ